MHLLAFFVIAFAAVTIDGAVNLGSDCDHYPIYYEKTHKSKQQIVFVDAHLGQGIKCIKIQPHNEIPSDNHLIRIIGGGLGKETVIIEFDSSLDPETEFTVTVRTAQRKPSLRLRF